SRRRSRDPSAAGENAGRSTAPGSNEAGAPECSAQAEIRGDTKSAESDPASSNPSLRSSQNENDHTLSSLERPPEHGGGGMRSGSRNRTAAQQGPQPDGA